MANFIVFSGTARSGRISVVFNDHTYVGNIVADGDDGWAVDATLEAWADDLGMMLSSEYDSLDEARREINSEFLAADKLRSDVAAEDKDAVVLDLIGRGNADAGETLVSIYSDGSRDDDARIQQLEADFRNGVIDAARFRVEL